MAARVKNQAGGVDDRAAPSIPPAFRNDLTLGATEAIMWITCRRRFSHDTIRKHLERRTRNLRRFTGSEDDPRLQVSPALSNRVDKAQILLFHLIIGGVPAIGTLDDEGDPDHEKRIPVPVEFLKDGAYIELLSGRICADSLLKKHWGYQRPTYLDVDIDRDAFFKALAAVEPRSQATPTALSDKKPQRNRKRDVEADAKRKCRIEMVLAMARTENKNKRLGIRTMAKHLENKYGKELGFKFETIRQILRGTYKPAKNFNIHGF